MRRSDLAARVFFCASLAAAVLAASAARLSASEEADTAPTPSERCRGSYPPLCYTVTLGDVTLYYYQNADGTVPLPPDVGTGRAAP